RKKKAKTATDSIVAEDVGQFPDKNIGEAISRIAGVALERGNFNEGESISLRGAGSDQTNVELDGLGLQNTSLTDNLSFNSAGSGGRAKDFRDLPADLIKSVDVVKGSTAASDEGGLGGSVIIQTRNGLDFKKPYFSFSYNLSRNSLGQKLTPTVNVIASRKFFNNKLGVILNYSYGQSQNDNDQITQGGSNNTQGMQAAVDFDNSPNKTYSLNPATTTGPDATTVLANSSALSGTTPGGAGATPLQIVTLANAAKTKADCYAAFPKLVGATTAQNTERTNELISCLNQWNDYTPLNIRYFRNRDTAQLTTLNLRFDYKLTNDLQVFFAITDTHRKVDNNQLTYTPGAFNINTGTNGFATGGNTFTDTLTPADPAYGVHRVANTAATGYYAYPGASLCTQSTTVAPNLVNCNGLAVDNAVTNVVNDSTLKVDANHHVISATVTDGTETTDQIHNTNDFHSYYISAGGQYRHGPWAVDFIFGDALSHYTRYDERMSYSYTYGLASMNLSEASGLWSVNPATAFNQGDPAVYSILKPPTTAINPKYVGCTFPNETAAQATTIGTCTTPTSASPGTILNPTSATPVPGTAVAGVTGYTVAQQPWTSNSIVLQWQPKINVQETQTAKIDVTYNFSDKMPFITDVKAGIELKQDAQKGWANGGATVSPQTGILGFPNGSSCAPTSTTSSTPSCLGARPYQAAVIIPTNNLRTVIRACDDTKYGTGGTAAPAGALSCNYGVIASTSAGAGPNTLPDAGNVLYSQLTLHQSDFQALVASSLADPWYRFFNGYADRGSLTNGWDQIDVQKVYDYAIAAGAAGHYNFDCVVKCLGSDGVMHYQPYNSYSEFTTAGYFMVEFEQDLPFGVRFNGNAGTRYVKTQTNANGFLTLNTLICNNPADCSTTTTAANKTTLAFTQGAHFDGTTTDWTPSYNYNLWFWDDKIVARYYWGKTIARPPANRLLPAGTCTLDQALEASGGNDTCSGIGNPNLKPFKSTNQNWSLEYYPNKDTQFSYATFKNNIKVNNPISCSKTATLFAGTDTNNPISGASIATQTFTYSSFCDGPGLIRKGNEYAMKTAFTFLPWYFKYLGFDGNYATIHSVQTATGGGVQDPNTGETLPPVGEPAYYYNASLWYDDGATNVRLAYQARAEIFNCIEPCTNTSGSISNTPNASGLYPLVREPYDPGAPTFTAKTAYLDAKITHKWKGGVEGYLSIKNALNYIVQTDQSHYAALASGTPVVLTLSDPGSRIDVGITIRR
ncbi:MAG TPA: TonB-dependent receptor plug domain-containing protein, partial [Asticcacaulis sp.]|nr:TonB-dependent receptor plug domain-containing protein [Asticcacaulis sp.]